jgi:transcriptional regulator with XRE-family HTH domain
VFGEAFRFYREQRGYNHARVADIAKVSRSDVEAWEDGRAVPDNRAWELLKKMLHRGLSNISPNRQQAISEIDAERALAQRALQRGTVKPQPPMPVDKPLTTKPFADAFAKQPILKIVPDPKPEPPKPEPPPVPAPAPATPTTTTPEGVPATLLGDDFDLTDAYTTVNALPDGWGTAEARGARAAFAKQLLIEGLDTEVIVTRTREKFTVGISRATLKKLRAEIEKDAARAERKAQREAAKAAPAPEPAPAPAPINEGLMVDHVRAALREAPLTKIEDLVSGLNRKFGRSLPSQQLYILRAEAKPVAAAPAPTPTPERVMPDVNVKDIEAAAQIVLSAIPNLKTFTISVDDKGEVTVSHTTREVRVVEASGSIKLKR